jgi:hypothetical protein
MLADLTLTEDDADHEPVPDHDADSCPFCRAKKKKELAGMALVEMVDGDGSTPQVDARQLLDLSEGQTIVVLGEGQINSLGTLVIQATGVYVKS